MQNWLRSYVDFYDVIFNFFISQNGVYDARGWDTQPDWDGTRKDFLFIGVFYPEDKEEVSRRMCRVLFNRFLEDGKVLGKISPDYDATLAGHDWGLT